MAGPSSSSRNSKRIKSKNQRDDTKPTINPKVLLRQVQQKYGGTTPQEIAVGTQAIIEKKIQTLPSHLQQALPIYRQVLEWDRRFSGMDLLAQSQLPSTITEQHHRAIQALQSILDAHGLTVRDLQVTMQQITWDASADAKTVKSLTGSMGSEIESRVQKACQHVAEAIADVNAGGAYDDGDGSSSNEKDGRRPRRSGSGSGVGGVDCLDVGCGYGVLVPYLRRAGIAPDRILGVDLSSEMIRNARSLHPDVRFEVGNFMDEGGNPQQAQRHYKAVIFCASLHDLPDMERALRRAKDLIHPGGGRLIIVHPQGASHVAQQHRSNPVMVPRGLPTAQELEDWLCKDNEDDFGGIVRGADDAEASAAAARGGGGRMELFVEPAPARSEQEIREGYLAVLRKW
jgi:2-polyprenyl-3-methyl-5-hydroxy-6-metoxy-1,4-benzoquinol methylase